MSPRVPLSLKAARNVRAVMFMRGAMRGPEQDAYVELDRAIAKAERQSATRRKLAKPKAEKRATKREARGAIRFVVFTRSRNACEACGLAFTGAQPAELDHFWGRARAESITACWMLCRCCHRRKTANQPDRALWLTRFAAHCDKHGYTNEAAKARRELSWVESKAVAW